MTDDIVKRLRNGGARCSLGADFAYPCKPGEGCDECDCAREAANEIERLRGQLAELLPFAQSDAELGASLGPHPGTADYDDCDDCQWYDASVALLARIHAGEFT